MSILFLYSLVRVSEFFHNTEPYILKLKQSSAKYQCFLAL